MEGKNKKRGGFVQALMVQMLENEKCLHRFHLENKRSQLRDYSSSWVELLRDVS